MKTKINYHPQIPSLSMNTMGLKTNAEISSLRDFTVAFQLNVVTSIQLFHIVTKAEWLETISSQSSARVTCRSQNTRGKKKLVYFRQAASRSTRPVHLCARMKRIVSFEKKPKKNNNIKMRRHSPKIFFDLKHIQL